MTCAAPAPVFRLLDAFVGWDPLAAWAVESIEGLDAPDGIRLSGSPTSAVDGDAVSPWLPPPRLSRGAGGSTFFLAGAATDADRASKLLRLGPCDVCFRPFGPDVGAVVAVAASRGRLAVVGADGTVWVLVERSARVLAELKLPGARLVAFTPRGDLLIVRGAELIERYGLDGGLRDAAHRPPPGARLSRIGVSSDGAVWAVVEREPSELWVSPEPSVPQEPGICASSSSPLAAWRPASPTELAAAFGPSGIGRSSSAGFCLEHRAGDERPRCFDFGGCPAPEVTSPASARRARQGQLLTAPLDSGMRRCEWHRVRVDASVPPGTTLEIAVAVAEQVPPPPSLELAIEDGDWRGFAAGVPHALDWQARRADASGSLDFLIQQPRGRFLFLRVRMTSDGHATPLLRRVRIDLPRSTSLAHLPAVFAEHPEARAFTEQYLSLFDATVESFDDAIERFPQLLDIDYAPPEALPWIARLLAIELDGAWGTEQRRTVLREAMELYRRRGTRGGLAHALRLTFPETRDRPAVIRELALERPWGSLGAGAALGSVHLFGRSRARFRLGSSTLGVTPVKSFGDPSRDPIDALASRIDVQLPPEPTVPRDALLEQLRALVEAQKPAHTIASVHVGGEGLVVGVRARVGVDTVAAEAPPAVVGGKAGQGHAGTIRLGQSGTLRRGREEAGEGLGAGMAVGIHTALR